MIAWRLPGARAHPRPTIVKAAVEVPLPKKRPDVALPLIVAAFFLGVVLAAAAFLGMQISAGDTVPARVHRDVVARLAAATAAQAAQRDRISAQGAALDDGQALERRLIAALGAGRVSAGDLAALRSSVEKQTRVVERIRVVPGPVVTVTPAPTRATTPAAAARPDSGPTPGPTPTAAGPTPPAAAPRACIAQVLGLCLSR